jgi:hypothetical protein
MAPRATAEKTSRHHHRQHHTFRPFPLRLLSALALTLPPALYIISLSFTLATIYTPSYALSDVWNSSLLPYKSFSSPTTYKASPWYACTDVTSEPPPIDNSADFNQTCTRIPSLGNKAYENCLVEHPFDEHFCQKVVVTAQLYVAGAVLIGIALLPAIAALAFGLPSAIAREEPFPYAFGGGAAAAEGEAEVEDENAVASWRHGHHRRNSFFLVSVFNTLATLLALLAAVLLAFGQLLGFNVFVDTQIPDGIDTTPGAQSAAATQGNWYMGKGLLIFTTVAYLAGGLGAFVQGSRLGVGGL